MSNPTILLLALLIDAVVGDPQWLYRAIPHPATVIGQIVGWLDRELNDEDDRPGMRRFWGIVSVVFLLGSALTVGWIVQLVLLAIPLGWIVVAVLMSTLIAQNGLYLHVAAVAEALEDEGLDGGREAVRHIVGRDPEMLDEPGVARASLESLAENLSDGVTAPIFWALLLGLPGILAYKVINTADSMIGHRTERHELFGWAAARLDDLLNYLPARVAALVLCAAAVVVPGASAHAALQAMRQDARRHRSPNAGWPEAALAGGLGLALAGPRIYDGELVDDAWMNEGGRAEATPADIRRALKLFIVACTIQGAIVAVIALIV
jgi:adenosylcobinamide-phosphate synthase